MTAVDALYIFDEHNNLIVSHKYVSEAPSANILLPLYLEHPSPRPSLIYVPSTSPPTLIHSIIQDNILLICPTTKDSEPLAVLEFLHRVADALEEFLGRPLMTSKITGNYDVVAQVISEMADGGTPCQSEPNALRDVVETGPGVLNNLLGNLGIQGTAPTLASGPTVLQRPQPLSSQGSAIPWRRSNVRHTSNEMYVDIIEDINAILAPSGRPLSAFANGSIAFTSKVSGIPDIKLTLTTGGKGGGSRGDQLRNVMEHVVFHPCIRLNRWKNDGVLSFVPPDGRFALCGYEVDLVGPDMTSQLNLPVSVETTLCLGQTGNEFEVRVRLPSLSAKSAAQASLQSHLGTKSGTFRAASSGGDSKTPVIDQLAVRIPLPPAVRNISELRASLGEAHWSPTEGSVEWKLTTKELQTAGSTVSLRCVVQGPLDDSHNLNGMKTTTYDYDEAESYQEKDESSPRSVSPERGAGVASTEKYKALMPTATLLSFSIKGWLISGLKVESLLLDSKTSKGVGADIKPYKGVKYLSVSRDGIEARC